ncbi:hypothetical protein B0T17DRAFT_588016 [Bombardia bombarda]|uniref:Polyketide synthase n=1 Tax=Bombardia bombarda TaxID=252184 RepID=A0AA39XN16_9PEZI|nr:hypothetical protein B0T17DRAFT_588016 [Bombardia bombarda]
MAQEQQQKQQQQHTLYLFGDQTYDVQLYLKSLLRHRDNPVLEDFLVKAYDAIRSELYKLPAETREDLPRFTCHDDLILWDQGGNRCVALDMAITTIYQLGTFISQTSTWDIQARNSHVLGICTGALAAAAVSCSHNTVDLIPLAVDAVIVSFRAGLHVTDMARRVEPFKGSLDDKSWSIVVPGLASADAVGRCSEKTTLPLSTRPYVSAYAPNGVTISGPLRALHRLSSQGAFESSVLKSIPIHAPYHAPHLYSSEDVDEIITSLEIHDTPANVPLLSGNGKAVEGDTFESRLKSAVTQILLEPLRWNGILQELQAHLQTEQPTAFKIVPLKRQQQQPALSQDAASSPNPSKPKLAIIGMSGRFPGAKDNDAFWNVLHQGLDMHKEVPPLRWDARTHSDPTGTRKNTSVTPFGCWLDDPAAFDARFFNISPREAPQIDPAQRIALMTAYEAIEQAGIVPDATPSTRRDRVGVFYGVTSQDWFETNSAQQIDTYFIPGGNMAFIPGRINYFFKFSGPSFAVNTACSSSLAGIHMACNSLWRGDIDTAIAGGTNVLTNPDMTAGLDKGHFLSQTGNCKTFDDGADGYCRGEGVGTIIIKRLDDAIADKDPILGVILGAATNHSAESESITRPHVGAQRAVFNKILNQGGVDPYTVGYVEMHGTGTQAGDAGEMSSVLDTFAPHPAQTKRGKRNSSEALYLGSAKANIGHGGAASGMASLIKVLLMLQKNTIVPHCGIKTKINHRFPADLKERNVNIALKPTSWERSADPTKPRRAFVNNFSAAGGNTAILLEDAPLQLDSDSSVSDTRSHHVVAVSAKNGISLQENPRSLLGFLKQNPDVSLGTLSYTTTARRIHHQHRVMLTGASTADFCAQIDGALASDAGVTRPKGSPKIVFTYTGQGAQYPGMGKDLYENFTFFRTELRRLDRIGQKLGFPSFLSVIDAHSGEQDIVKYNSTAVQLSSVCMQIALTKLWETWGVTPAAVLGHSLGEYAALNIAGVLSDADTIYLVGTRATLLQAKCTRDTHTMVVIKASVDEITEVLKYNTAYEFACINSPTETVIAGITKDIAHLGNLLKDAGMETMSLKVPYAFHSSQTDPVLEEFKTIAGNVTYSEAQIPVLCPLDGSIAVGIGGFGPEYLARHTREPVNMFKALQTADSHQILTEKGVTLEIGPHPAISGMVKAVLGSQVTTLASAQRGRPAFQMLSTALKALYIAGADIKWAAYHEDFKASHRVIPMPVYKWDPKPYWIQYVNDWSLRKGDPPLTITIGAPAKLESTTIHHVVEDTGDYKKARVVIESDVARKDFRPLVEGHEVDGVPLCTPAVYAEIALTLVTHLLERYHPNEAFNTCLEVADITILKALILDATPSSQQVLQVQAEADWSLNSATVRLQEHSNYVQKLHALRAGINTGITARFNRAMTYRSIRPSPEASSRLSFKDFHKDGDFHTHPGLIDGLTWAAGFSMNCNDYNDLDKDLFVNHGWRSFQVFEPMDFAKEYTTYSRMIEGVPRRVLKVILDVGNSGNKAKQQPTPKANGISAAAALTQTPSQIKKAPSSAGPDTARGIAIIADESGLAVSDLTDSTNFADVGVDSLLGLTISARFREELDLDLDFNALFFEYPTVGDLKGFLGGDSATASSTEPPSSGSSNTEDTKPSTPTLSVAKGPVTPQVHVDFNRAIAIISEESVVAMGDLTDDANFGDCGVDSLLSLVIVSRFRDELELDIQHESLFLECPTVADLRQMLGGDSVTIQASEPAVAPAPGPVPATVSNPSTKINGTTASSPPPSTASGTASLEARQKAIDEYVTKYTTGWTAPSLSTTDPNTLPYDDQAKVVLITGASGSLGGQLAFKLAQRPDVHTVVCLNRSHRIEASTRQKKAMKDKGVHFPDPLLPKLLVLQTDTSAPNLGLSPSDYSNLANTVTHIIHQAWPMSVKRPLAGFEPQFAAMRNLIDLATTIASRRTPNFRVGFQLVSSISVVGNYRQSARVPEDRRMLDQTLHASPAHFRAMTVRLGQIAGSSVSGYWNPLEHFGFMMRSSQTLNALPDVDGTAYWTPVDVIAQTLAELGLPGAGQAAPAYEFYHIENPVGQSWRELNAVLAGELGIPRGNMIPLREWTERVRQAPQRNNPASVLVEFLDSNYERMSCGGLVLEAKRAVEHSATLRGWGRWARRW